MDKKIAQGIRIIYLCLMLALYPLLMHNLYFDISYAKLFMFYLFTGLFILADMIEAFVLGWANVKSILFELIFAGVFMVGLVGTFMVNGHSRDVLSSQMEFDTGIVFLGVLALGCISFIRFCSDIDADIFAGIMIFPATIYFFICLLQFSGADPFGLIGVIADEQQPLFLGTMGNNAYTGLYAVVVFPICVYGLTYIRVCKEKYKKYIFYASILGTYLSAMTVVMTNTDGSVLAFAAVIFIIGIILLQDSISRRAFYLAMVLSGLGFATTSFIAKYMTGSRGLDYHERLLASPLVVGLMLLIGLFGILNERKVIYSGFNSALNWICKVCLGLLVLLPMIILCYTNLPFADSSSAVGGFLYFDNHWGTDRGYLWKAALEIYSQGSPLQLLFGQGPGGFARRYVADYYEKAISMGLYPNYDAHNIYLQFLVEYGLVGIGSALGFLVIRIRKAFCSDNPFAKIRAAALIGALVAGIFIVFQNITLGLLPVLV